MKNFCQKFPNGGENFLFHQIPDNSSLQKIAGPKLKSQRQLSKTKQSPGLPHQPTQQLIQLLSKLLEVADYRRRKNTELKRRFKFLIFLVLLFENLRHCRQLLLVCLWRNHPHGLKTVHKPKKVRLLYNIF